MSYEHKNRLYGVAFRVVETGDIFETRTACAEFLGVSPGMITMMLNGKVKSCRGYHVEVVETVIDHPLTDEINDELYSLTGESCEWREHPNLTNIYVSDTGLIAKNVRGCVQMCRQSIINSGYFVASVLTEGTRTSKNRNRLVHRLVAETFIPNDYPEKRHHINHIDGNKLNNCVWNLEWCSASENARHAFDTGLHKSERVIVVETGKLYPSSVKCAEDIGGTVSGIHDCKSGRQKKHRGYHFIFPEEDE